MRAVRCFAYTVLLAILSATDCLCLLWLLALCGSAREELIHSVGTAPLEKYLSLLASNGDFWHALIFFLLSSFVLAGVVGLLRRERRLRREEIASMKICENETEWEQQP